MKALRCFNRQKTRAVDLRLLRRIGLSLLEELGAEEWEIAVHLVGSDEMTQVNQTFLDHEGPTDVITFDYSKEEGAAGWRGEIFICVDEAVAQARRFRCRWQWETARYLAHGLLHIQGHDDTRPGPRRRMKRRENKLLKDLSRRFDLGKLERRKNGRARQQNPGPLAR